MGKFLESKYSQIQNRTMRKFIHRNPERNHPNSGQNLPKKPKRKISIVEDEPRAKKPKTGTPIFEEPSTTDDAYINKNVNTDVNPETGIAFLKCVKQDDDLFAEDEAKASCHQYIKFNFIFMIFDEISLEGLDGITLEALWKRLTYAFKFPVYLDQIKHVIWRLICANPNIKFYKLPEPRDELVIPTKTLSDEIGCFYDRTYKGPNIYKVQPLSKIYGSCTTLETRVNITNEVRNIDLNTAQNYKNELVIVADEKLRFNALFGDLYDVNYEMTTIEYCILEKIGRSRHMGEITQGVTAIGLDFNLDSKSIHHYKNRMLKQNLISEQFHVIRNSSEQNQMGKLLHLSRFYTREKTKNLVMTEAVVNYLKKCRGYKAEYSSLHQEFGNLINRRLYKNPEFLKFVQTNMSLPYKEFHPFAPKQEYLSKNAKEKFVKSVCLKNPYVNVIANWSDGVAEDDEDVGTSSDEENVTHSIPTEPSRTMNLEYFRELFLFIKSKGLNGVCVKDVLANLDVDKSLALLGLKTLIAKDVTEIKRVDIGRQRINQHIATCLLKKVEVEVIDEPEPIKPCGVLDRLKQKAKEKIDALSSDRVYNVDQFEADQKAPIITTESLFVSSHIEFPKITIKYLIAAKKPPSLTAPPILEAPNTLLSLYVPDKAQTVQLTTPIVSIDHYWKPSDDHCFYQDHFSPDYQMKAFLIAVFLGDAKISTVLQCIDSINNNGKLEPKSLKRKRSESPENHDMKLMMNESKILKKDPTLDFMGSNPVVDWCEERENGIKVEIVRSTPSENTVTGDITICTSNDNNSYTERVSNRRNIILNVINSSPVFKDLRQMLRLIILKEKENGINSIIDLKSLNRLLRSLVIDGFIKIYTVTVSEKNFKKTQVLICHPDITYTDKSIQEIIDATIFKLTMDEKRNLEAIFTNPEQEGTAETSQANNIVTPTPLMVDDVRCSINELKQLESTDKTTLLKVKQVKGIHLQYGYRPKFPRMSILHELMFYLIYELNAHTKPLPMNEVRELFTRNHIELSEDDLNKMPFIYCKEISWKMFIPPLPIHSQWDVGWAMMCDIILRIPVTLIANLLSINYLSTELQEILRHPVKRFYLLKDLSARLRCLIMLKRRYVYHMHANVTNLCFCGLLQFGPSKYHDKDQCFLYLNRKATLYRTTTSESNHFQTSDQAYEKLSFEFTKMADIQSYWFTMHSICMNTRLLSPKFFKKATLIQSAERKPELVASLAARTQDEAKQCDIGKIPGDKRGAAGLDSALFSHRKRNWFYVGSQPTFTDNLDKLRFKSSTSRRMQYEQLRLPKKFYLCKSTNSTKKINFKPIKKCINLNKKTRKNRYYDAVDQSILKQFRSNARLSPIWTHEEDKIIILLKLASMILSPKGKTNVTYSTMRDVLHQVSTVSQDKTSKAIPRRWISLSRELSVSSNIKMWLSNLLKLKPISNYFLPLRKCIMTEKDSQGQLFKMKEKDFQTAFLILCQYIFSHRNEVETAMAGNLTTIDYFSEANIDRYKLIPFEEKLSKYTEPENSNSIRISIVKNMLQSTIAHSERGPERSYKLYQLYQRVNNGVLEMALSEMKELRMISRKTALIKKTFMPFILTFSYINSHSAIFSYPIINETNEILAKLQDDKIIKPKSAKDGNYGQLFAFNEISTLVDYVDINIWVPEQPFVLNPSIEDHGELIDELARRYLAKLINELDAKSKQQEEEQEPDEQSATTEPSNNNTDQLENLIEDNETIDLSNNSTTIDNLKNWITNCIDTERVRSPSPELLIIKDGSDTLQQQQNKSPKAVQIDDDQSKIDNGTCVIPTLDQIKEEMLKTSSDPDKCRTIPYVTDLTKLLTENFDDVKSYEQKINNLKQHFVQQYPILEEFRFNGNTIDSYIEDKNNFSELWQRISKDIRKTTYLSDLGEIYDRIIEKFNGTITDMSLVDDLLLYISEKGVLGATGPELKEKFSHKAMLHDDQYALEKLLNILLDNNVVLKSGITIVKFIHYKYQSDWLLETSLNDISSTNQVGVEDNRYSSNIITIKPLPWITEDGAINMNLFKLWLTNVLSYCIENPGLFLSKLFEKFHFITPVDLFYLIEILEEIGCVEMRRFQYQHDIDIFAKYEEMEDCKKNMKS